MSWTVTAYDREGSVLEHQEVSSEGTAVAWTHSLRRKYAQDRFPGAYVQRGQYTHTQPPEIVYFPPEGIPVLDEVAPFTGVDFKALDAEIVAENHGHVEDAGVAGTDFLREHIKVIPVTLPLRKGNLTHAELVTPEPAPIVQPSTSGLREALGQLDRSALRKWATEAGVKGAWTLRKEPLIEAIVAKAEGLRSLERLRGE